MPLLIISCNKGVIMSISFGNFSFNFIQKASSFDIIQTQSLLKDLALVVDSSELNANHKIYTSIAKIFSVDINSTADNVKDFKLILDKVTQGYSEDDKLKFLDEFNQKIHQNNNNLKLKSEDLLQLFKVYSGLEVPENYTNFDDYLKNYAKSNSTDNLNNEPKKEVKAETDSLLKQMEAISNQYKTSINIKSFDTLS